MSGGRCVKVGEVGKRILGGSGVEEEEEDGEGGRGAVFFARVLSYPTQLSMHK